MPDLVAPSEDVVVEDLDEDICLYRAATDDVLVLNRTAGDVWRLIDGTLDVDRIVSTLAKAYGVPSADIEDDVQRVLSDLRQRGFTRAY